MAQRDDLIVEKITLLNQTGEYEKAMSLIGSHKFHPWEGGEGKVSSQYQFCRVELAKKALEGKEWKKAETLLEECLSFPQNLGEGKLAGAQDNDFWYFLGIAHEGPRRAREGRGMLAEGDRRAARSLQQRSTTMMRSRTRYSTRVPRSGLSVVRVRHAGVSTASSPTA